MGSTQLFLQLSRVVGTLKSSSDTARDYLMEVDNLVELVTWLLVANFKDWVKAHATSDNAVYEVAEELRFVVIRIRIYTASSYVGELNYPSEEAVYLIEKVDPTESNSPQIIL